LLAGASKTFFLVIADGIGGYNRAMRQFFYCQPEFILQNVAILNLGVDSNVNARVTGAGCFCIHVILQNPV
jgi:hypothetical protein